MTATTQRRRKGLLEVLHRRPEDTIRRLAVENLVGAKLEIPEAAVAVIPRQRLFVRLDVATAHRVTVLDAPAGSGKTVLLASWLRERPRQAAAWLSLDEGDNRPTVFWAYLLAALGRVCPSLSGLIMPTGLEAFVGELARRLAGIGRPVVLVLDDAHVLRDPEVLAGLDILVRRAPATLRLVLAARGQPALALARLRVSGHVDDLTFADLAGTPAEAAQMLALWGADIRREDLPVVMAQTEGWMGGFRLAALWRAAQPDGERSVETFTGDERVVADYLRDEVFRPLPEARRQFLLRTCLFDRLSGSLADTLTGEHRGSLVLDEMEREIGLVAVDGPYRGWFRYRPLLRQFLRAELSRELPCEVDELRRRAAHWYAERRLTADAVRAAVDGKDWDFAISLVATADRAVLAANRSVFEPALRRIPGPLLESDSALAAVFADLRLTDDDPEAAEPYLRLAERPLADGTADLVHRLRCSELRLLQACLRGSVSLEQVEVASELLDAGEAALPGAGPALGLLASRIGLSLVWIGRPVSARLCLQRALRYPDMESARRRRVTEWTALLLAIEGRLADTENLLEQLDEQRRPGANGSGPEPVSLLSRLSLARLNLERERLNEAWRLLVDAPGEPEEQENGEWGEPPLAAAPALQRAEVLIARGQGAAARVELETVRKRSAAGRTQSDLCRADMLEVRLLLSEGNPARAREVLDGTAEHAATIYPGMHGSLVGELLLAEGSPEKALTAVAPYLAGEVAEARLVDVVSAHLVAAAAHRRLGAQAPAEEQLRYALALAEPHRAVRVFVRAGRVIRSLLTVAVPQDGPYGSMRALLLHNFDAQTTPWEDDIRPIRLTASEAAILTFLPEHPTNEEIAADLFVSVNTVKTHLRSLYRKLGVASRREAVARARQRGLLPD